MPSDFLQARHLHIAREALNVDHRWTRANPVIVKKCALVQALIKINSASA